MTVKVTSIKSLDDLPAEEKAYYENQAKEQKIKDDEKLAEIENKKSLKASAKAKLMAGEPLTEEEANVMIGG